MVTKKKKAAPPRRKTVPALAPAPVAVPVAAETGKTPANWKFIAGLVLLAVAVTQLWDMRYWQTEGFKFRGWSKPEVITAVFKGAVAERGDKPENVLGCLSMAIDKAGAVYYLYGGG